MKDGVELHGPS